MKILIALLTILLSLPNAWAGGGHSEHEDQDGHSDHAEHDDEHEDGFVEITLEAASAAKIRTSRAASEPVANSTRLFGRTVADPQKVGHVQARYPGMITNVYAQLGEQVAAGDTLLEVEANDSLRAYQIRSPISGTVVERHANPGEFAGEHSLLTIVDFSTLWVSLDVFPQDAALVHPNQAVTITAGDRVATAAIKFLNPKPNQQATIEARVPITNSEGQWTPGLFVEAEVLIDTTQVAIAVENNAVHDLDGEAVVFIYRESADEPGFKATPVTTGISDSKHTEIIGGMSLSDLYALENSYLLKAELEKSSASHAH